VISSDKKFRSFQTLVKVGSKKLKATPELMLTADELEALTEAVNALQKEVLRIGDSFTPPLPDARERQLRRLVQSHAGRLAPQRQVRRARALPPAAPAVSSPPPIRDSTRAGQKCWET
jgi:hypothetical protein